MEEHGRVGANVQSHAERQNEEDINTVQKIIVAAQFQLMLKTVTMHHVQVGTT